MGRGTLLALVVAAGCAGSSGPAAVDYVTVQGQGLGTRWTVRYAEVEGLEEDVVQGAVLEALREVDEGMSTWRDDSDLARVRAGGGPVVVAEETAAVVREALALAQATGGAFDPTVQPLVELWGFQGTPRTTWPSDAELAQARGAVGWERVRVGRSPDGEPTVDAGGTALDLSAIAKGHAVDRVFFALARLGVPDIYVEIGGEVRTAGRSPRGGPWTLGIESPDPTGAPQAAVVALVGLTNAAMATSGNYRSAYQVEGRTVHHTLDPRTGLPAASRVLSATVVAPDARTADGWATALMVLGGREGLALLEDHPTLDAWLVLEGGEVLATSTTDRWVMDEHGAGPVDDP